VSDGGLELALQEAEEWSGLEADVDLPDDPRAGAAILALPQCQAPRLGARGLVQIGEVR
jgi:hypothetical protein